MDFLSHIGSAFASLLGAMPLILIFAGVCIGILGGAIPGISPSMAVALLLPITYSMSATHALLLLMGIYIGANYGGSITAVSINTPGTPSATVTSFDGYPLVKSGKAGVAMGISLWASVFGGIIGIFILIFAAEPLAKLALNFWPSEYFALCILGLTTVATLGGKHWQKALACVLFGLLINTMGLAPYHGIKRFAFGINHLYDGIAMVPALIGLFALGEVFVNLEHYRPEEQKFEKISYTWPKLRYYWKIKWSIIRSGIMGCVIGVFPGAGGTIASFLAYDMEKRVSRHPDEFGRGAPEGVAAAEAANSASVGGAMVPLLSLGIPGSSTAAVLLGALMIHNLTPGPELFIKEPDMVNALFASMFVANVFMALIGVYGSKLWVRVCDIPRTILYPLIFAFSILGSYSVSRSMVDVIICLVFGVLGWLMKKYDYPVAPVVLGIVLGKLIESNFCRALAIDGVASFYTRPLTVVLLALSLASVALPLLQGRRKKRPGKSE